MFYIRVKWKKLASKIDQAFFSEEPDWYWGLFVLLFSLISTIYVYNKNISIVHSHVYHALPLFDFFHIPNPYKLVELIGSFFPVSFSIESFFYFLKIIFVSSLLLCFIGYFQRLFIFTALNSFFLFHGYFYGYIRTVDDPRVYHSANIVWFILLIWLMAPVNFRWTALFWIKKALKKFKMKTVQNALNEKTDKACVLPSSFFPKWPRLLVILTIGLAYFGSFYCKFDKSGFQWINGHNLQSILLSATILRPLSYAQWLVSQNFYLLWFLSIGVWFFQSTAFMGFLFKKTRLIYAFMGLGFHISVFLFMGVKFTPFYYFYVIFISELIKFFLDVKKYFKRLLSVKKV